MSDFGKIIKEFRVNNNLTRELLSERLDISTRYLLAIETENKKPSFDLLYKLIRELSIPADLIFYPEYIGKNIDADHLYILLSHMNHKSLNIVKDLIHSLNENL